MFKIHFLERHRPFARLHDGRGPAVAAGQVLGEERHVAERRGHLEMLRQAQAVMRLSTNFRLLDKTPLTIGVMATIGPSALAPFLVDFRVQHPGVELSIVERPLAELIREFVSR